MSTAIEWCDETFNPWWGCEKVSPGCAHCYAETLSARRAPGRALWGAGHSFRFFGEKHWNDPRVWDRRSARDGRVRYGGREDERIRVFCASMADVFEDRAELVGERIRLFRLVEETPNLDWLILTKRPDLAAEFLADATRDGVLSNVWLGTSIENARWTWRADALREVDAAVRFISAEPLLGSLFEPRPDPLPESFPVVRSARHIYSAERRPLDLTGIDWVIVGGESGPGARPMHPGWTREIRDACLGECVCGAYGDHPGHMVPLGERRPAFFFKQWGAYAPVHPIGSRGEVLVATDGRKLGRMYLDASGEDPSGAQWMRNYGKRMAGRVLDGRLWDEFPVVRGRVAA